MSDIPDAADLLETARDALLSDLLPALPKERRYVGLMVANAMAIAAREHRLGSDTSRREAARLRNRLADIEWPVPQSATASSSPDLTVLRDATAAAIRTGHFDAPERCARLAADLLHTAADWVAISNPKALRS